MMMIVVMMMSVRYLKRTPATCLSYPQLSEACLELMVLCLCCIDVKRCQGVKRLLRQDSNPYLWDHLNVFAAAVKLLVEQSR